MAQNPEQSLADFSADLEPGDIMIPGARASPRGRPAGTYPDDAYRVDTVDREGGTATMAPQGGGMVGRIAVAKLHETWRKVTPEEIHDATEQYRPALFSLDGLPVWIEGVTTGERWNGCACPWFTREAALAYLSGQVHSPHGQWLSWSFDEETGLLKTWDPAEGETGEDCDEWAPEEIDGVLRYPLGAGCWTWESTPHPRHHEEDEG